LAAHAVTGGDEQAGGADDDGLGGFGEFFASPGVVEEDGAIGGVEGGESADVVAQDELFACQSGEDGRGVVGLIVAGFPDGDAGFPMVGKEDRATRVAAGDDDMVANDQG
jgi:hypothetical protein